ncbi:hypothetical protein ACHAWF_002803 [Thalassiosira exigua]
MSSERTSPGRAALALARIRAAFLTNQKLAFAISTILAFVVYAIAYVVRPSLLSSPYDVKRHGLGAGDLRGELRTALKRKGDGRAAVAIVRVLGSETDPKDPSANPHDDVKYLVQLKSHDYPIGDFRGTVCLLGGNANKRDATPLETLKRELNEELGSPEWVDAMDEERVIDDSAAAAGNGPMYNSSSVPPPPGTVRYLGASMHFQSSELLGKKATYAFLCALYEVTLRPDQLPPHAMYPRGANVQEGRVVLLTEDQLVRHSKYAWGYEYTMEKYFGKTTANKQKGTAISNVDGKTWKETVWTPAK